MMSGQVLQKVMEETNELISESALESTEHEKGKFISPNFFCLKAGGTSRPILNFKTPNEFLE